MENYSSENSVNVTETIVPTMEPAEESATVMLKQWVNEHFFTQPQGAWCDTEGWRRTWSQSY